MTAAVRAVKEPALCPFGGIEELHFSLDEVDTPDAS